MMKYYAPPEEICQHFSSWLNSVVEILIGADMKDELTIWSNALKGTKFSDDASLDVAMSIAQATLYSILNNLVYTGEPDPQAEICRDKKGNPVQSMILT